MELKKVLALTLAAAMTLSLAGCGSSDNSADSSAASTTDDAAAETTEDTTAAEDTEAADDTADDTAAADAFKKSGDCGKCPQPERLCDRRTGLPAL